MKISLQYKTNIQIKVLQLVLRQDLLITLLFEVENRMKQDVLEDLTILI